MPQHTKVIFWHFFNSWQSLICKFFAAFSPNLQGKLIVNHIKYFEQPFWSARSWIKSVLNEHRCIWSQTKLCFPCPFIQISFGLKLDLMWPDVNFFQEYWSDNLISVPILRTDSAFVVDLWHFYWYFKGVFFFVTHATQWTEHFLFRYYFLVGTFHKLLRYNFARTRLTVGNTHIVPGLFLSDPVLTLPLH